MIKMAATLLTITDLAARLESDPRTTRKFLRSITPADEQPGKGSRWAVPATKVQSLKSKFKKYQTEIEDVKSEDITDEVPNFTPLSLEKAPIE
jgi:hypothetical protein